MPVIIIIIIIFIIIIIIIISLTLRSDVISISQSALLLFLMSILLPL